MLPFNDEMCEVKSTRGEQKFGRVWLILIGHVLLTGPHVKITM